MLAISKLPPPARFPKTPPSLWEYIQSVSAKDRKHQDPQKYATMSPCRVYTSPK